MGAFYWMSYFQFVVRCFVDIATCVGYKSPVFPFHCACNLHNSSASSNSPFGFHIACGTHVYVAFNITFLPPSIE